MMRAVDWIHSCSVVHRDIKAGLSWPSKLCWLMHCFSHHLAPSKIKRLLCRLLFIRICTRFTCWDIRRYPQRLDDHIPASTDAFASSTEGSTGLASQSVGQPWRAKWTYWIWWGNFMFADVCVCFGRFLILECVQCLGSGDLWGGCLQFSGNV